ncbi:MAG: DUF6516 family protein [Oligoflexia bacterium]
MGTERYPDGLKWGLVCIDQAGNKRILMDNHHPKGPHIHVDDTELPYRFTDLDQLVADFRSLVKETMGVSI